MAAITVRNLSDETHRALKVRAVANGRSTEAEIRAILDDAVTPPDRVKLGTLLRSIAGPRGIELDIARHRVTRDPVDLG